MSTLLARLRRLPAQAVGMPKNIKLFLITVLSFGIAVDGVNAVLLNLYLLRLGYGTEFIGTLNSAGLLIFALVSLPIGAVQRYSSRNMLQIGQVLSLVGMVGFPLAAFAPFGQAGLLITFKIISMIGLSCYFVHQLPFAMEITKPAWHSRILSLTMATFSLAAFFGSWFGGLLPGFFGQWLNLPLTDPRTFQMAMLVASSMLLPAMLAIWFIPEGGKLGFTLEAEPADRSTADSSPFGDWRLIVGLLALIVVVRALQTSGLGIIMTFSNVYFDEALLVPTSRIGLITGFGRLLGVPMSLTIPWLVRRFGNFNLVIISLGLIAVLIIPIAFIPYWPIAALALMTITSMGSLRYLSFISFTMSLVSEKQRSLVSGAGEMALGIGFSISSFIGGYLIAWYGYSAVFVFGATVTVIGTVIFWVIFRKRVTTIPATPAPAS